MRKLICIIFILNFSISFSNFLEHFTIKGFIQTNKIFRTSYQFYFDGNSIFTFNSNKNQECDFSLTNETKKITYYLKMPSVLENRGFINFIVENDTLFFTDYKVFHAFKLDEDTTKHLFSTALLVGAVQNMKKIGDIVYLFGSVVTSSGYQLGKCTRVEKIMLRVGKQSMIDFPDPNAIGFSFFGPTKIMDIKSNLVAIADYDKYKVKFYNMTGELVDSIDYINQNWQFINNEIIPKFGEKTKHTINYMNSIRPYTAKINLIHRIDFLVDKLLVCWSEPTGKELEYKFHFDIWIYVNNKWIISESSNDFQFHNDQSFNNYSFNLIPQNYFIQNNSLLLFLNYTTVELVNRYIGKNNEDYLKGVENYFKNNVEETSLIGIYEYK